MVVTIARNKNLELISLCEKGYPFEVCGYLLGNGVRGDDGSVIKYDITEIFPVKNINQVNPKRMFEINPLDFIKAEDIAKEKGLCLLGVYHSHPDEDSYASSTDNAYCQVDLCALIYSVKNQKFNEVKAFIPKFDKLKNDTLFFEQTQYQIL